MSAIEARVEDGVGVYNSLLSSARVVGSLFRDSVHSKIMAINATIPWDVSAETRSLWLGEGKRFRSVSFECRLNDTNL